LGSGWANYNVDRNDTGATRSGIVYINGATFVVTQTAEFTGSPRVDNRSCVSGVFGSGTTFAGDGGDGWITVSAPGDCAWTASTDAPWISVGIGSASCDMRLPYTVQANPTASVRTAAITIGTSTFTVTQNMAGTTGGGNSTGGGVSNGGPSGQCGYAVSPFLLVVGSSGGARNITITAPAGCPSFISSPVPWVSVAETSGVGMWTTRVTIAANASPDRRVSTVAITGASLTVDQNGSGTDVARFEELGVAFSTADAAQSLMQWSLDGRTGFITTSA